MTRHSPASNPHAVCSEIIRDGFEFDRQQERIILHAGSPRRRSTIANDLRSKDEATRPTFRGRYAPQLVEIIHRLPITAEKAEVLRLVMLRLQVILLKSWTTESTINGATTEQERAALSYVRRTVFGASGFYQNMDVVRGPLGMAFSAHGFRLGIHDVHGLGPFTHLRLPVKERGATQQLAKWLSCRTLPRVGWLAPRRRTPEEPSSVPSDPEHPGRIARPPATPRLDRYLECYPWSQYVNRSDASVYRISRVMSRCVRLLRSGRTHSLQEAIDVMRLVVIPDPLDEDIVRE